MSSFGEALVASFNGTFRTVTSARLQNEQARALRIENDGLEAQRREVRESQIRNGLLNPDGTTNDPGQNAQRAQLQAPAVQGPLVNPQAPAQAPAAQPPAPAPPPTTGAVGPAQPPAAAPTPAPAASPTPPRAAAPAAPQAPGGGSPRGAVAQAAGQPPSAPGAAPGGAPQGQSFEPAVPPDVIQRGAALVEAGGNQPVDAMIVAPYTIPDPARGPGGQGTQAQAAQYAPTLVQEIAQHRGEGQQGPLTRANWNAYLRDVTLAAQRNLSPQQQVQALAVVDRIRTAGMQRFTALAVAAAQSGDMEGAARALNGASNFNPDGFQDTFRATQGGVEMVRRPEEGENGQPQRVTVPAAEVVRYATAMLDPTWSLNHFLQVRRQNEEERSNRAREGLQAAGIAESRAARAERRDEQRAEREGNNAYARAVEGVAEAERALARLPNDAPAERRQEAERALEEARAERRRALPNAGERGLRTAATIEAQRRADEDRDAQAAERRAGRTRLTGEALRDFRAAEEEFVAANTTRGQGLNPAAAWARANGQQTAELNPNISPGVILDTLQRFRANPGQFQTNPNVPGVVRTPEGVQLRLPEGVRPSSNPRDPGRSSDPPAPRDEGNRGSVQGARPPPATSSTAGAEPRRIGGVSAEDAQRRGAIVEAQRRRSSPTAAEWVADNASRSVSERELQRAANRLNVDVRELRRMLESERGAGSGGAR